MQLLLLHSRSTLKLFLLMFPWMATDDTAVTFCAQILFLGIILPFTTQCQLVLVDFRPENATLQNVLCSFVPKMCGILWERRVSC